MDIGVYSLKDLSDSQVENLLREKKSFEIEKIGSGNVSNTVATLEKLIESMDMKCRVYTIGRKAIMAAAVTPNPVTFLAGVASSIAIGAHNVATWNPDYEIGKYITKDRLLVEYKKQ